VEKRSTHKRMGRTCVRVPQIWDCGLQLASKHEASKRGREPNSCDVTGRLQAVFTAGMGQRMKGPSRKTNANLPAGSLLGTCSPRPRGAQSRTPSSPSPHLHGRAAGRWSPPNGPTRAREREPVKPGVPAAGHPQQPRRRSLDPALWRSARHREAKELGRGDGQTARSPGQEGMQQRGRGFVIAR
jgi:hypothetical protein